MAFNIGVDMSAPSLLQLDGTIGGQLDAPVIKVGAGASYAKEKPPTITPAALPFLKPQTQEKVLRPLEMAAISQRRWIQLANNAPGNKFANLGDEFVSAIEYSRG